MSTSLFFDKDSLVNLVHFPKIAFDIFVILLLFADKVYN